MSHIYIFKFMSYLIRWLTRPVVSLPPLYKIYLTFTTYVTQLVLIITLFQFLVQFINMKSDKPSSKLIGPTVTSLNHFIYFAKLLFCFKSIMSKYISKLFQNGFQFTRMPIDIFKYTYIFINFHICTCYV